MAVPASATRRILVVDDDPPIRRMLERTLQAEGYDTSHAPDGGAALARSSAGRRDAIVLDVVMPGIDGLAVARRLRAKGDAVPILLLTARDAVSDRVAGLDAGADDYLVKPFAVDELTARLRALLRRGNPPPERPGQPRRPDRRPRDPHRLAAAGTTLDLTAPRGRAARAAAAQRRPGRHPRRWRSRRSGATAGGRPPTPSTATSPTCAASSASRR